MSVKSVILRFTIESSVSQNITITETDFVGDSPIIPGGHYSTDVEAGVPKAVYLRYIVESFDPITTGYDRGFTVEPTTAHDPVGTLELTECTLELNTAEQITGQIGQSRIRFAG